MVVDLFGVVEYHIFYNTKVIFYNTKVVDGNSDVDEVMKKSTRLFQIHNILISFR